MAEDFIPPPSSARAVKAAPAAKSAAEITTWYLAPKELDEWRIVNEYMRLKRPQELKEGLLLDELNLAQVGPNDAVVVVSRGLGGAEKCDVRPVHKHEISGQTFDLLVPHKTLAEEVLESDAVRVDSVHKEPDGNGGYTTVPSYWAAVVGRHRQGGTLKRAEFIGAIGRVCSPLAIHFSDGNSCREPQLPQILTLGLV